MTPDTVLVVTGTQEFLRQRFLNRFVTSLSKEGRQVTWVDGELPGALASVLSEAEFTGQKALVILSNPHKADLSLIEDHSNAPDDDVVLVLNYDGTPRGNTHFGKLVEKFSKQHKEFKSPQKWEADEYAVDFCMKEARERKLTLKKSLAEGLVQVVGNDLGFLAWEILKYATLAQSQDEKEITQEHVKALKAEIATAEVMPIIRALEARNAGRLVRTLGQVYRTSKDDPTMKVCRIVGASVQKWLTVASLDAKQTDPKMAAEMLGMKPWFYENKLLPAARTWGLQGVIRLVQVLAQSERSVLSGVVSPWTGLVARLVQLCERV